MTELDSLPYPSPLQLLHTGAMIFYISRAKSDEYRCLSDFAPFEKVVDFTVKRYLNLL